MSSNARHVLSQCNIRLRLLYLEIKTRIIDVLSALLSGRPRFCPKLYVRRCYVVRYCYRYIRICRCVPWRLGDETEIDNQLNDEALEAPEDEAENSDETSKSILTLLPCNE